MQRTDDTEESGEEPVVDRVKDDMANRRISSHIPAPLRKKKNEEQYKKFITPTGNPVAYLQQHMRSKSMSDLNEEKKEEEHYRAEINMRYEEMEKLKTLLKEEEDTWTSKLQSWKNRRRSVTEDARKRKEERDTLEKEAEVKSVRRKSKTYRQIVEDKMKRDQELAQLQDHDEYEFVGSPTSPSSGTTRASDISTERFSFSPPNTSRDSKFTPENAISSKQSLNEVFSNEPKPKASQDQSDQMVQYKYTTKVTAVINNPTKNESFDNKKQPIKSTATIQPAGNQKNVASTTYLRPTSLHNKNNAQAGKTTFTPKVKEEPTSNVPKVLMRAKNSNAKKERPKSAHDLPTGTSSTLPRNFRDYSTPKPFTAGATNFTQYRKTAFAKRRSMWESISRPENGTMPATTGNAHPIIHGRNASDEMLSSKSYTEEPVDAKPAHPRSIQHTKNTETKGLVSKNRLNHFEPETSTETVAQNKRPYPGKVPLVSKARLQSTTPNRHRPELSGSATSEEETSLTATLSASGLSMTSPHVNKTSQSLEKSDALFDDMKICINQRPRSEKGFGFTVRGGDDGKPVIVDTVSPGGAADICQLCVSDEILAINEVPLADCRTQDDIVQLIVSSVITGNLSLNIRRYGKTKKVSPLRLSGTKVVMTPGGFVQVRSDKPSQQTEPKTTRLSKMHKELSVTGIHKDNNNNDEVSDDDLPPPPSQQELSEAFVPTSSTRDMRQSPLTGIRYPLVSAASQQNRYARANESFDQGSSSDDFSGTALSEVHSKDDDLQSEEDLRQEVLRAQKALEIEQDYQYCRLEEQQLRLKLREEQLKLEEEETQREQARIKLQEEAKLEDMRVQEELRRIQARKLMQQQERRKGMERMNNADDRVGGQHAGMGKRGLQKNGIGFTPGGQHWMIEEAERRRVAEMKGKPRVDALQYARKSDSGSRSGLPDHVIRHLTQQASRPVGPRPYVKEQTPFM